MLGFFCSGAHDLYFTKRRLRIPFLNSVHFIMFVVVVVVVNMWFASILLYLFYFFLHFYGVYFTKGDFITVEPRCETLGDVL